MLHLRINHRWCVTNLIDSEIRKHESKSRSRHSCIVIKGQAQKLVRRGRGRESWRTARGDPSIAGQFPVVLGILGCVRLLDRRGAFKRVCFMSLPVALRCKRFRERTLVWLTLCSRSWISQLNNNKTRSTPAIQIYTYETLVYLSLPRPEVDGTRT